MMSSRLIASAAAGCQRTADTSAANTTANQETTTADTTVTADTNAAAPAPAAEPAAPQEAVQAAQAFDQATSSPAHSYGFSEGGAQVEAAEAPSEGLRLRENGRSYFYRPGQPTPYLVQEGGYSYAYHDGQLAGVLDAQGRPLDQETAHARQPQAEQVLARARMLRAAADRHAPPQMRAAQAAPADAHGPPDQNGRVPSDNAGRRESGWGNEQQRSCGAWPGPWP